MRWRTWLGYGCWWEKWAITCIKDLIFLCKVMSWWICMHLIGFIATFFFSLSTKKAMNDVRTSLTKPVIIYRRKVLTNEGRILDW